MVRPHTALALCLLSLVAASVAQDEAQAATEAVAYQEMMTKVRGKIRSTTTNGWFIRVFN